MRKGLLIFISLFFVTITLNAQEKYITKTGHVWFFSHAQLEDIEAHTLQGVSILVPSTGKIEAVIKMMSFEFSNATMQEHFNSNYMESATYPTAKFVGTIVNLNDVNFKKDGVYNATVEGDLTIHGVTKKVNANGTVETKNDKIMVKSKFNLKPKDYNITIESRFVNNIAEILDVNVDMTYELKK